MLCVFVALGREAGEPLEETAERRRFVEAEPVGRLLDGQRRLRVHQVLGLRDDILLNPVVGRETVGGGTNDPREMLGRQVQPVGIESGLASFTIMGHHEVAEAVEQFRLTRRSQLVILLAPVEIDALVSDGEQR